MAESSTKVNISHLMASVKQKTADDLALSPPPPSLLLLLLAFV